MTPSRSVMGSYSSAPRIAARRMNLSFVVCHLSFVVQYGEVLRLVGWKLPFGCSCTRIF
jgi:hypothetical protein